MPRSCQRLWAWAGVKGFVKFLADSIMQSELRGSGVQDAARAELGTYQAGLLQDADGAEVSGSS